MERLNDRAIKIINELHGERLNYESEYLPLIDAAIRLAAYEDTGLEPEEILQLKTAVSDIKADVDKVFEKQKFLKFLESKGVDIQAGVNLMCDIFDALNDGIIDLDRLRELVEADRDERCVVLPFRPPKTMYACSKQFPEPQRAHYAAEINILCDMDRGYVFGDTPEAAKEALRRKQ